MSDRGALVLGTLVSLAACGGTSPTRGAEPAVTVQPAAASTASAGSPAPGPAAIASPALAPIALASPARWKPDGWRVAIPRTSGVELGEPNVLLGDAALRAHGAQRIEPTQWLLRVGQAPCLATVRAYVEHAPGLARDGSYDENQIDAVLTGCAPSADDGAAVLAWAIGPEQLAVIGGDGPVRLVEAKVETGANVDGEGRRNRRQRRVPAELAKLLTLPACARGCVRDWTLRTLAAVPVIQQLKVLDHDLASRTEDDGSGMGPRWETAIAADAVFVGRTRDAQPLPTLSGALMIGDVPRALLFDDGNTFATARFEDGRIAPAAGHFVHELGGY